MIFKLKEMYYNDKYKIVNINEDYLCMYKGVIEPGVLYMDRCTTILHGNDTIRVEELEWETIPEYGVIPFEQEGITGSYDYDSKLLTLVIGEDTISYVNDFRPHVFGEVTIVAVDIRHVDNVRPRVSDCMILVYTPDKSWYIDAYYSNLDDDLRRRLNSKPTLVDDADMSPMEIQPTDVIFVYAHNKGAALEVVRRGVRRYFIIVNNVLIPVTGCYIGVISGFNTFCTVRTMHPSQIAFKIHNQAIYAHCKFDDDLNCKWIHVTITDNHEILSPTAPLVDDCIYGIDDGYACTRFNTKTLDVRSMRISDNILDLLKSCDIMTLLLKYVVSYSQLDTYIS